MILFARFYSSVGVIWATYGTSTCIRKVGPIRINRQKAVHIDVLRRPTMFSKTALLAIVLSFSNVAVGSPTLEARQSADNIVYVTNAATFCMIMPRNPHTNIGDSETPGGMQTYCSPGGKYDPSQGQLPANFWSNVDFQSGTSSSGGRFAQLTGCIRPETLDRLNPNDGGGQYDSSGGAGGQGNPAGSVCLGYNHYVELVEPGGNRACIKCCDNPSDCPVDKDTQGCPNVIQGNYFDCS